MIYEVECYTGMRRFPEYVYKNAIADFCKKNGLTLTRQPFDIMKDRERGRSIEFSIEVEGENYPMEPFEYQEMPTFETAKRKRPFHVRIAA